MVKQRDESKQEFAKRLNGCLTAIGIPERGRMVAVAKMFSVSNSAAKKWLDGDAIPNTFRMSDFAAKLKVRAEWLFTGHKEQHDIDIGNRIKSRRIELKRKNSLDNEAVNTMSSVASQSGIPLLRYCMIEEGKARTTLEELEAIADTLKVDVHSLIGREPRAKPLDLVAMDHFDALGKIAPDKIAIPVYENVEVSAGAGTINDDEYPTDMLWLEKGWLQQIVHITPDDMVVVKVRGDSMEPTLSPGDMILIDLQPVDQARMTDGIYVINRDGLTHVKRLQMVANGIKIISDNMDLYEPEIVNDDMTVIGRVVFAWCGKKF